MQQSIAGGVNAQTAAWKNVFRNGIFNAAAGLFLDSARDKRNPARIIVIRGRNRE
jgi:hypothetical protein